jgi:hypothetical protein
VSTDMTPAPHEMFPPLCVTKLTHFTLRIDCLFIAE